MLDTVLTMQQMVRRSGVEASALRYYESLGLIWSERTPGGQRRFSRPMLRRVAFIVFAQRIGMSLKEVGEQLANLPSDHVPTGTDWSKLSGLWVQRVDERIAELERLKAGLIGCIGCGCLSMKRCQLYNPNDRVGLRGSGPRFWVEQD